MNRLFILFVILCQLGMALICRCIQPLPKSRMSSIDIKNVIYGNRRIGLDALDANSNDLDQNEHKIHNPNIISKSDTIPIRPSSMPKVNSLMFLFYATLGSVMPFIPVYYKQIGISDSVIGLLGAITPAVTFIASPLWGAIADKTGKHKSIMIFTFLGSVLARLGFVYADKSIFWLSLIVAITAFLSAPVKPLMDSAVMSMLTDKSNYGRSRLFGQLGFGMGSYMVGPYITNSIQSIFQVQAALSVPTTLLMMSFRPTKEPHHQNATTNPPNTDKTKATINSIDTIGKDDTKDNLHQPPHQNSAKLDMIRVLKHALHDQSTIIFFSLVFLIGISSGIIENFAYIRIGELTHTGSSNHEEIGRCLGVCRLVSSVAAGPMFWLSGEIAKKIGIQGILTMSLASYVLRFFNYALLRNPWQALPAEILRGITFATFWAGSTYYVYNAAPNGLTATMLSLLNGVYHGIGQSLGALVGGYLSKYVGISMAFITCGFVDLGILSVYLAFLFSEWRRRPRLPVRHEDKDINKDKNGQIINTAK